MAAPYFYNSAPAIAIIDQNNVLTVSFTPIADPITGSYSAYDYWDITTTVDAGPPQIASLAPVGYSGGSLTFTEILSAGVVTLTMQAYQTPASSPPSAQPLTNLWGTGANGSTIGALPFVAASRTFPTALTTSSYTFSATSLLLGQTLTVTLNSAYTGADQWQVLWPDNTSTGWLPLATGVVTKSFSTPGTTNVIVQTRKNYSAVQYNPPTQLISQITQQIFVVDQQAPSTSTVQGGLTGDLGIGGQQGFEIVNATSGTVTPQPWEVIARAMVRDTVTNELKLLIATSRFSNASSLLGTMALDVFPIEGRPRQKDLVVPPYELTVTSNTGTTPVSITTPALSTLFVGKSVVEALGQPLSMLAQGGIQPYIWSSVGLPAGLTLNASGILGGTPFELGLFSVTIAVQDSSDPFSIDEQTYSLTIASDLEVIIAPGQVDANNTSLLQTGTTLGAAQVGAPYNVEVQVGNIDPNETGPGGLPPYTWSAPAGAFPTGLSITTQPDSLYGLVSGTPSTYNSTTDFNTTYSVTIQVTDSIGAKATQTYTMTLKPEELSFGHLNQTTLYVGEKHKLVVPVFGGQSPYTFNPITGFQVSLADEALYGTPALVDGQIEIPFLGTTSTGTHTFTLLVTDTASNTTGLSQFSFAVETKISDVGITSGYLVNWAHPTDGSWYAGDTSEAGQAANVPFNISGNLEGYALSGLRLNLTAVSNASGSPLTTTYTMPSNPNFAALVGQVVYVSGFSNDVNNGMFTCTASTATLITLNNQLGVAQSAPTYTLTLSAAAAATGTPTTTTYTVSDSSYGNGSNNALVGIMALVAGFSNASNNGSFLCTASTASTVTLLNSGGVHEVHAATATTPLAKALGAVQALNGATLQVLTNNITMALDPTYLTMGTTFATGAPDVEWVGPPGQNPSTSVGQTAIFSNTEARVPMTLLQNFPLASVATSSGGNAVYTFTTPVPVADIPGGSFVGDSFIVTGFTNAANNNAITPYDSSYLVAPLSCQSQTVVSSTVTAVTLNNGSAVAETNSFALAISLANYEQVSREYTMLSHNASGVSPLIGNIVTYTRPYIVSDVVGLNPRKPYYDSPNIPSLNAVNAWTATVQGGSLLPPGLSLDANTGLIYGTLTGTISATQPSVIEYVDVSGVIHGTVTINWITLQNSFSLTDNENLDSLPVNPATAYSINAFTAPTPGSLVGASLMTGAFGGNLPLGLTVGIDPSQTYIVVSGTPTEAGYFDCWFQAQTNNGQTAYAYHRVSTVIPDVALTITGWCDVISFGPPVVLGPTMPFPIPSAIVSANYVDPVTGYPVTLDTRNPATGIPTGDPPYTFSSTPSLPSATVGANITLSATAVVGHATAGMLSGGPVTAFTPTNPVPITFSVTDFASNTASITTTFASQASSLTISPMTIPSITAGQTYGGVYRVGNVVFPREPLVTLTGHEISPQLPYNFTISPVSVNPLPTGITLRNATSTTAMIQGTTTQTGYGTKTVTIRITDNIGAYTDVPYSITVINGLTIQSGIDYEDSLAIGALGFVSSGNVESIPVRPNLSFYIVATNVVSTSLTGITVTTNNPNIAGVVQSLNATTHVAQIELSGSGFDVTPSATPYSVAVTVIDSGVTATQTFTWTVYNNGTMSVVASNATPTRLTTPT